MPMTLVTWEPGNGTRYEIAIFRLTLPIGGTRGEPGYHLVAFPSERFSMIVHVPGVLAVNYVLRSVVDYALTEPDANCLVAMAAAALPGLTPKFTREHEAQMAEFLARSRPVVETDGGPA